MCVGGAVKARWMFQFNPGVNPIDPGAAAHTAQVQVPGYNSRYKLLQWACKIELQTKVREDFSINEKAP